MKNTPERYIALLMALIMCFSFFPASVFAEENEETTEILEPVEIVEDGEITEAVNITEPFELSENDFEAALTDYELVELVTMPEAEEERDESSEDALPEISDIEVETEGLQVLSEEEEKTLEADSVNVIKAGSGNNEERLIELPVATAVPGSDYSFRIRAYDMTEAQLAVEISSGSYGIIYPADNSPVIMETTTDGFGNCLRFTVPGSVIDGDILITARCDTYVNCHVKFEDNYNVETYSGLAFKSFEFTSPSFIPGTYSAETHIGQVADDAGGFAFEVLELPVYIAGSVPNADGASSDPDIYRYSYDFSGSTMGGAPVAVTDSGSYYDDSGFHRLYAVNYGQPLTGDVIIVAKLVPNQYLIKVIGSDKISGITNRETYVSGGKTYYTGRRSDYPTYRYLLEVSAYRAQTRKLYLRIIDEANKELRAYPYNIPAEGSELVRAQIYGDYIGGPVVVKALGQNELDVFVTGERTYNVSFPYNKADCELYNGCIANRGEDFVFSVSPAAKISIKVGNTLLTEGQQFSCTYEEGNVRNYTVPGQYMNNDIVIYASTEDVHHVPDAPTVSLATVSGGLKLSWNAVEYADRYFVYRAGSESGSYTQIGETSDINYTDSSVSGGTVYYYKVTAVSASGECSDYSNIVSGSLVSDSYIITFDPNGGENAPAPQIKPKNVTINITTDKPTREGYSFLGWSLSKDDPTVKYKAGGKCGTNASRTLYAVWKLDGYIITFDANGGENAPAPQIKPKNVTINITTDKPTREGYSFLGWSLAADDTTVKYKAGGACGANASRTLYAVWKLDGYIITFDANGGENAPAPQIQPKGVTIRITTEKPTRTGYTFLGWSLSPDSQTIKYKPGGACGANITRTVYAIWKKN